MTAERGVSKIDAGTVLLRFVTLDWGSRAPSPLCTTLEPVYLLPLPTIALPAFRASSIHFLAPSFLLRGRLGPFSAPVPPESLR